MRSDPGSKNTNSRDSILSRAGASGGVSGLENAVCIERRARPTRAESKVLISNASLRFISGK